MNVLILKGQNLGHKRFEKGCSWLGMSPHVGNMLPQHKNVTTFGQNGSVETTPN
jgi:hypothetical protein